MTDQDFSHEISFWENHLAKKEHFIDYLEKILDPKLRKFNFSTLLMKNLKNIMVRNVINLVNFIN